MSLKFKLPPMAHQSDALKFMHDRRMARIRFNALLMEQGTGKTFTDIANSAELWEDEEIDTWIVVAPNGVQSNWVLRELPKHMPDGVEYNAAAWYSGANMRQQRAVEELMATEKGVLRVLTINYEALLVKDAFKFTLALAKGAKQKLKLSADESQRIKNHKAQATKAMNKLQPFSCARSILSGTPVLNGPWDAFSQFMFLNESLLGTTSYAALRAEYAELLPSTHGLMRHIAMRKLPQLMRRFKHAVNRNALMIEAGGNAIEAERLYKEAIIQHYLTEHAPPVIAKDKITGRPKWRNLEKLEKILGPHSFRVLKKDCLDLPDKIYVQRNYSLTPKQQEVYNQLKEEFRLTLTDGTIQPLARLGALQKLAQVCSGYFLVPGTKTQQRVMTLDKNPKMQALIQELETCFEIGEQVIVWANFQAEIEDIARVMEEHGWRYGLYYGPIGSKVKRNAAIDDFEAGRTQSFVSNQAAGGVGLTLIAPKSIAKTMSVLYYSNSNKLGDRIQSEDRAHRIGQEKSVRYVDFIGDQTIEVSTLALLANKQDVADLVTGDARRAIEAMLNFQ